MDELLAHSETFSKDMTSSGLNPVLTKWGELGEFCKHLNQHIVI